MPPAPMRSRTLKRLSPVVAAAPNNACATCACATRSPTGSVGSASAKASSSPMVSRSSNRPGTISMVHRAEHQTQAGHALPREIASELGERLLDLPDTVGATLSIVPVDRQRLQRQPAHSRPIFASNRLHEKQVCISDVLLVPGID